MRTEDIIIPCHILRHKIKHLSRIDGLSQKASLEMQVRSRRKSGIASQANGFSGMDNLVLLHQMLGQMPVDGLQPVRMTIYLPYPLLS